jgi:hypothetical protein
VKWLVISWFLSFGWVPEQVDGIGPLSLTRNNTTFAEIGISGEMADRLTISASVETFQALPKESAYFAPYLANYRIGASLRIIDGITLNADHLCTHPVLSSQPSYLKSGGMTRVYLKIEGKAHL